MGFSLLIKKYMERYMETHGENITILDLIRTVLIHGLVTPKFASQQM